MFIATEINAQRLIALCVMIIHAISLWRKISDFTLIYQAFSHVLVAALNRGFMFMHKHNYRLRLCAARLFHNTLGITVISP